MSVKQSSPLVDYDIRNPKFSRKNFLVREQESIDQRLGQLKEDVLPFYPFLLTVPTDVPFRLGERIVNNWAVGKEGLFTPEEQQLQYMTFLTHQGGDSLLVAVGDWSDEADTVMERNSGPRSATGTPPDGMAKRRITLSDYKNKRKNGTTVPLPNSQDAISEDASMLQAFDHRQGVSTSNSPGSSTTHKRRENTPYQFSDRTPPTHAWPKRPSESQREYSRSPRGERSEMPSKRQRLSAGGATKQEPTYSKSNRLPDLLSPTLPSTSPNPRLPRLLSPTLPPSIERDLARLDEGSPAFPKGNISKPKSPSHDNSRLGSMPGSGTHLRGQSPKGADKPFSTGVDYMVAAPRTGLLSHNADNSHRRSGVSETRMSPAVSRSNPHPVPDKVRLIVKLKYGRSNRRRVEGLLKFPGKKKATQLSPPAKERYDYDIPQSKKKEPNVLRFRSSDNISSNAHPLEKEQWSGLGSGTSERERSGDKTYASEKVQTPIVASQPSVLVEPVNRKSNPASDTPLKDYRGPTPNRNEPADGDEKSSVSHAAKSSSREYGTTTRRPSPPPHGGQKSRPRDSERRVWKDEFFRYSNLGRELKHAAERYTAKEGASATEQKLAVATAIEAILCFILAFVADDQSKALARQVGESSNWLSILAYWRVVKKNSSPYPALHNLCHVLGAVSYDAIHALDLERLSISPIPGEHTAIPTPGSDGDSVVSDESRRSVKEFLELKNRLPECYKESQRYWLEGARGLSEAILASEFPATWSKRSRNYSERGRQQLKVGNYLGEFFLPLGKTSSPLEAVRFGWSILNEWCAKESVNWKGRLEL